MSIKLATITAMASNDIIKKSDAVIWLEGDGLVRREEVVRLYRARLADFIVVSGGLVDNSRPVAIPAPQLAEELYQIGIPKEQVIVESQSQNTFEQGIEIMKIVAQKGWQKIILVASHYHQLRAYLTFLQTMVNAGLKIQIYNSPARDLLWFEHMTSGKTRAELFKDELKKITEYSKKGHVYPIPDALKYQAWKEAQS